jgi:Mce-associated membrane protein
MPPRPRSPRPRPTPSRRPRVAGLAPTVPRPSDAADTAMPGPAPRPRPRPAPAAAREAEPSTVTEAIPVLPALDPDAGGADPAEPAPSGDAPVAGGERRAAPTGKARRKPSAPPRRPVDDVAAKDRTERTADAEAASPALLAVLRHRVVPLLASALVVLAAVAVVAGIQDARLRGSPAAANTALVDVGATAEVAGQLSDAVETIYSFDFARLDENENAARDVITPEFAAEFDRLFGEVRARAPQQQAVVSATVTLSAVKEITGDRAVLVAFVDQQATRAAPDAESQQLAAAGRLTVTGERVDGRWKIAAVTPL